MEKKYTLQDLAALLAERESLPLEQAEDFVRSFFELTEEGLLKDSFVKVTGFGTFKLVEVSERESVNINTGERFQISGHNKISFTPDGTLRELVNRPFAHFTTVTLNDKTPETALEEAERPLAEESTESSATSSHTPLPAPETPVASSPSCETNTTAPAEEEQQPDVATEKAEENVVPAVEAIPFAPTSAHVTVTTEAPTPEVSAEQAHEEAKNNQSVSTAPAATTTSSLLLRPTPAPIIDGALLVSQTPTPVLNNEQLSDLLSHTPDDTAATAEDSDEEESNVPPVSHDTEEETNEKRFEENEVHETCVTTAEEEEETHEEEEETHEETTTLPEEDTPQHPTTYEEHTVDQPIDSAHQTPATEMVSTVATPVLDLNLAEESTPESTTTSAEAAEQLVEAPTSATEAAAPLSPASTDPTETESEKSAEEQESHGPALQFVPTREALRALADEHTESEPDETPAIEPQLRDQFRIPVNIEIRHAEPEQDPVPAVTDEASCANETPAEENEVPTLVGETSDEPSTNAVETAQTPAAANDDPSVSSLPTEETAEPAAEPAPSFAAPQLDLESLEAPTPVDAEEAETPVEDTPSAEAPLPGETPETESSATLPAEEENKTPEETIAGTEQLLTVAAPILTYPQSTAEEICDSATQSATVESPTAVDAVTSTTCTAEETLGKEVLTDSTEELPLELTPTGSVSTGVAEPQSVAASTAQTTAATAAGENEVRESSSHHSRRRRHRSRRKKTPWGPILGIILLLLLLLCCYFGYLCQTRAITPENVPTWLQPLYQICAPEEDDGQNTHIGGNPSHNKTSQNGTQPADQRAALTKAKADSIATAEKAAAAQKAAEEKAAAERQARIDKIIARSKRYSQVEGGSFLIVGLHDKHKMKSGDNVYKLAERTFGDRSYAKYIIHFNNISNPDFIKVNEVLKIPELVNPKNIK
jgi:putative integration host factor IHF alpha subunit